MESLKASRACPYFWYKGHATVSVKVSSLTAAFSATCLMIEWTVLDFENRSSHLITSSAETRRFDKSM